MVNRLIINKYNYMISYHYLEDSKAQLYELFSYFSVKDKIKGRTLLKEMGKESVINWLGENENEVKKYILSSPSQREKRKKWNQNFNYKFLIVYFAANYIERGIIFLQVLSEHPILSDESYREMSLKTCEIFSEIQSYDCFYDSFFEKDFCY